MSITLTSTNRTNSDGAATAPLLPKQTLGQGDFLKLLAAQLSAQDPLNPTKDTEFIAQMAQFSALEQSSSLNTNMGELLKAQALLNANDLIGRQVKLRREDNSTAEGVVESLTLEKGTPKIWVKGEAYDLSQVTSVALGSSKPSLSNLKL